VRLAGPLTVAGIAGLRPRDLPLTGIERIDLSAVPAVDTVGIALIAEIVGKTQPRARVDGRPVGLTELCQAYRITPDFSDFP